MASPTIAECHTQLKNATDVAEELRKFCETNAKNWAGDSGLEDTLVQSLESDYAVEVLASLAAVRGNLNGAVGGMAAVYEAIFRTYAKVINAPETQVQALITRIYDYFADQGTPITIKSRSITYGTPAAGGSNVGNGTIYRLTTDKRGYAIESVFLDSLTAKIVNDQTSGTNKHEEAFEIRGSTPSRDLLSILGSGIVTDPIPCVSARSSMLNNPSFSKYSGTSAVPTAITDWTPLSGVYTAYEIDETNYYRDFPGDTLNSGAAGSASLKIKGNDTLTQLFSVRGTVLDPEVPIWLSLYFNRQVGSGDGTLTLSVGSKSVAVVLAAQTGWNQLKIAIGTSLWHRNFNQADLSVKIQLASRTTGYVLVDDVIFAPWVPFDTDWIFPLGGSTPFLRDDVFTWANTCASDSKIQRHLATKFRRYLPHDSSPTVSDP